MAPTLLNQPLGEKTKNPFSPPEAKCRKIQFQVPKSSLPCLVKPEQGTKKAHRKTAGSNVEEVLKLAISEGTRTPHEPTPHIKIENKEIEDDKQVEDESLESQVPEPHVEKVVGLHVLKHILEEKPPLDTIICCYDGKVGAHRAFLVSASPFLRLLLSKQTPGEVATLVVADVRLDIMTIILTLCYTGETIIPKEREDEVYSTMEMLMIGAEADFSLLKFKLKERDVDVADPAGAGNDPEVAGADNDPDFDKSMEPANKDNCEQPMDHLSPTGPLDRLDGSAGSILDETDCETPVSTRVVKRRARGKKPGRKPSGSAKPVRERSRSSSAKPKLDPTKTPTAVTSQTPQLTPASSHKCGDSDTDDSMVGLVLKEDHLTSVSSDSVVSKTEGGHKPFLGFSLPDGNRFVCCFCEGILSSLQEGKKHLLTAHGLAFRSCDVPPNDMEELKKCGFCPKSFSTVSRAAVCTKSHGYTRCLTCLTVIEKEEFPKHIRRCHGVRTAFALVSICRWCDMANAIGQNGTKPQSHANAAHISLTACPPVKSQSTPKSKSPNPPPTPSSLSSLALSLNHKTPIRGSILPFLKQMQIPTKKRKLDVDGNPLQLSKRTGGKPNYPHQHRHAGNISRRRTLLTPPAFTTIPETGKVSDLVFKHATIPKFCTPTIPLIPLPINLKDVDDQDEIESLRFSAKEFGHEGGEGTEGNIPKSNNTATVAVKAEVAVDDLGSANTVVPCNDIQQQNQEISVQIKTEPVIPQIKTEINVEEASTCTKVEVREIEIVDLSEDMLLDASDDEPQFLKLVKMHKTTEDSDVDVVMLSP